MSANGPSLFLVEAIQVAFHSLLLLQRVLHTLISHVYGHLVSHKGPPNTR